MTAASGAKFGCLHNVCSFTDILVNFVCIFSIVCALNDGSFLPDAYRLIEPSLLFALRKPN